MLEEILDRRNIEKALVQVEANKGAAGIDGVQYTELRGHLSTQWQALHQRILEGNYKPSPVRKVEIPKPRGGKRMLGIPTVLDRMLQQAIAQWMSLHYEEGFSRRSYGFRPCLNAHHAVHQAVQYLNDGKSWVIELDLENFFDKVTGASTPCIISEPNCRNHYSDKPPYAGRHVRWCERTGSQVMAILLLDCAYICTMRHYSHIQSARQIIESYNGKEPFHRYIRSFFAQQKKFGSKDRKQISGLCYAYWRLGMALSALPVEDRILAGHFLCTFTASDPVLEQLKPEWNAALQLTIPEKFQLITGNAVAWEEEKTKVFSWTGQLSDAIDPTAFLLSFFIQPDLFLRARPGKEKVVAGKLSKAGIAFTQPSPACFAMANSTKIDELITLNTDAVVQDLSSQQVAEFLELLLPPPAKGFSLWDCCAGSGGKTILAFDVLRKVNITVSDKREQILVNLAKRFKEAGITQYQSLLADLAIGSGRQPSQYNYDLIIADVPCSGSGTWGRTPEWLRYFETASIDAYSALQKKIATHAIPHVKKGGHFLYITCSVFKEENEGVVDHILQHSGLQLLKMSTLEGYNRKADTMFAALFHLPATHLPRS